MLNTPVALIIFRRPELTARVLDVVRNAKPKQLLVVADGPRADRPDDAAACEAARAVIETVDWDCQVLTHYSPTNLGCGRRPATGIDWVFEQVETAIILEDDCVPHPSFFPYCEALLERYREDERVMHISGCTYRPQPWGTDHSYFFSKFPACWGWATWRRAWQHFDIACEQWPALKGTRFLTDFIDQSAVEAFWGAQFDGAVEGGEGLHYWDFQWAFACWANSGLSVFPRQNLVTNIGFGEDATHTFDGDQDTMNVPVYEMPWPLRHPPTVLRDADLDRQYVMEVLLPHATPARRDTRGPMRKAVARAMPGFVKRGVRKMMTGSPS